MQNFDFINDDDFRRSLEADYRELNACIESNSWKAAHVLAGSIVEAVLIDYLVSERYTKKDKALRLSIGETLILCKEKKILSDKTIDMASVIKSYRNLIHPGRIIRLKENVSENGAVVAKSLVKMVIEEVVNKKKEKHGYTAEQILAKIDSDLNAIVILPHLLKEAKSTEIEKLLNITVPAAYLECIKDETTTISSNTYIDCFRVIFEQSPDRIKRKVTKKFVTILKEEDGYIVENYYKAFFRPAHIKYLNRGEIDIVKEYLFSQLHKANDRSSFAALEGLAAFITEKEVLKLVDPPIRLIAYSKDASIVNTAQRWLGEELTVTDPDIDKIIIKRFDEWIPFLRNEKQNENAAIKLEEIKGKIEAPA